VDNYEIATLLQLTANLITLHGGDEFRAKAFGNAANTIEKLETDINNIALKDLEQQVSAKMAAKIMGLVQNGELAELEELKAQTPEGVFGLLKVKGLGPKKVAKLWKELDIDSVDKLKNFAQSGELVKVKGWGENSVNELLASFEKADTYKGKLRTDEAQEFSAVILAAIEQLDFVKKAAIVGDVALQREVAHSLAFLIATDEFVNLETKFSDFDWLGIDFNTSNPFSLKGIHTPSLAQIEIHQCLVPEFVGKQFALSASERHLAQVGTNGIKLKVALSKQDYTADSQIYSAAGLPYIIPEMREGISEFEWAAKNKIEDLITYQDLKGPLHNHSKYSDGSHSLPEIVAFCKQQGWKYLGIADHSQSGHFYNNGMKVPSVYKQWEEIEAINKQEPEFTIIKGIESDILTDGSLDYAPEVLNGFEYVVASIHNGMKMDIVKATERLLIAINNPYTSIVGHLTGRLLLKREGYPVDHKTIIDECARLGVAIEINSHPWRLDMDWRWLGYAAEQGVMISINPDAHEMPEFLLMKYGVQLARKAGLLKHQILNTKSTTELKAFFAEQKAKRLA
jgi:DNA polymerase (family 10)